MSSRFASTDAARAAAASCVQQAVAVDPVPYESLVKYARLVGPTNK